MTMFKNPYTISDSKFDFSVIEIDGKQWVCGLRSEIFSVTLPTVEIWPTRRAKAKSGSRDGLQEKNLERSLNMTLPARDDFMYALFTVRLSLSLSVSLFVSI